jgi:hypothetical protein
MESPPTRQSRDSVRGLAIVFRHYLLYQRKLQNSQTFYLEVEGTVSSEVEVVALEVVHPASRGYLVRRRREVSWVVY